MYAHFIRVFYVVCFTRLDLDWTRREVVEEKPTRLLS